MIYYSHIIENYSLQNLTHTIHYKLYKIIESI